MNSDDQLKLRRVSSGMDKEIIRGSKPHNTINLRQTTPYHNHITPKNERKHSDDYFYSTFNKIMVDKEIQLLNREKGNDFKIILLQRDTKESLLQQEYIDTKDKINNNDANVNHMVKQQVNDNEDNNSNQNYDLNNSSYTIKYNNNYSQINFQAKFILSIGQTPINATKCLPEDNCHDFNLINSSDIKSGKKSIVSMKDIHMNEKDNKENDGRSPNIQQSTLINSINNEEKMKNNNNCLTTNYTNACQTTNNQKINDDNTKHMINTEIEIIANEQFEDNREGFMVREINGHNDEKQQYETEFTFISDENRRYKAKDIKSKKDFFQMRYLNQNLKHIPKLANLSQKASKGVTVTPNSNTSKTQNNFYFYIDNRNVIKYISLFFKKIETSIFHFNTKQYDKAYHSLLDDNIIYTIDEFSEILLLIQGFDKLIIGEFLSNEKTPNEKYCITKALMSRLDFGNEDFLSSFRFFLSLFIIPKQNESLLLDYFSSAYFKDNLDKGDVYKSIEYVKSLCTLTIDANNIFVKQSKGVSREDFILFYPNVDKEMCGLIYDDIKKNNIILRQDNYNEELYKKLFDQNNKNSNRSNNTTPIKNNINSNQNGMIMNSNPTGNNSSAYQRNSLQKQPECNVSNEVLISILKHGEVFKQRRPNGSLVEKEVMLNEEEQFLCFKNSGFSCGFSNQKRIAIAELINIYRGSPSIKNCEYENSISLILKNNTIELYNSNIDTIIKWYNAINSLIKRNCPYNVNKSYKDQNYSSVYWSEIVNNWIEYRDILNSQHNKDNISSSKKNKHKSHFSNNINLSNNKLIKISKEDSFILWSFGLPHWIRNSLWKIKLIDKLDISENLLLAYQRIINEELDSLSQHSKKTKVIKELIDEINTDIIELYEKYNLYIQMKEDTFKDELYIIIRGFCFYRPDIIYSNQIAYFAMIFYLNANSYYEAFVFLCNFLIPNCFFQFTLQDEIFANEYTNFFNFLLQKHLMTIHMHFNKFGINLSIFFLNWVGYLFATTFEYETVLRIWDNYLLKGNILIFEIALAIVKLQEKELLNSSISIILNNLKYFPKKYSEKELFDMVNSLNIIEDFDQHFQQNEIGKEKGMLYQVYLN